MRQTSQGEGGGQRGGQARVERGRVTLSGPGLDISFSLTARGTISALQGQARGTAFIDSPRAEASGVLWVAHLGVAGGAAEVTNRDCEEFSHAIEEGEGGARLRLRWRGLRAGQVQIAGEVVGTAEFPAEGERVDFNLEARLPHHIDVRSVDFPILPALGPPEQGAEDALFLPLAGGVLVSSPRSALSRIGVASRLESVYPGPASLQLLGYSVGDLATVWLAALDDGGARKALLAFGMSHADGLALAMAHHPARSPDGGWSIGYATAVGVTAGDWFEAARQYRRWAARRQWCARGRGGERGVPAMTSSYGLWASHWGDGRSALSASRELQRLVNVPVKLDWHAGSRCTLGAACLDLLSAGDGGPDLKAAIEQLAEAGVSVQVAVDATWAARDAAGSLGAEQLRGKLCALARELRERGARGMAVAGLAAPAPSSPEADSARRNDWTRAIRRTLSEIREALGEAIQLAADGPAEPYLDAVDALFSPQAAAEREGVFVSGLGRRWSPIPLFSAVYHGYVTLVGPGASLVNYRPRDPTLPAEESAALRLPVRVMGADYEPQFCLEIARAAAWGHQLRLAGFSPEQARGESGRRRLAFLAAALRAQAWGVGALLPYSEFMGPLAVECAATEVDLLVNPPGAQPGERSHMRRRIAPVVGSAWRVPGSGLAFVLVNIETGPADFTVRLRSSRLGLSLPIQMAGRTFSEDGDAPGAMLRASGAEIGGRLPPRSIVLVSLR